MNRTFAEASTADTRPAAWFEMQKTLDGPQCHRASTLGGRLLADYTLFAMVLNSDFKELPTRLKAAIAATAINAAISAYSIAVTPDSSLTSFMRVRNRILPWLKMQSRAASFETFNQP